ncbi:MAG: glycosyltransferase [Bacteroidales bacterium]|nr:glycosyltransferase [Bacteroidales bacterium]
MKPRIFIAIHYMHLGGAEISLIGLLQALDPKKVDVDLFVYSHEGEFMKLIPEYVNVLPEIPAYKMFERPMKEVLKKGHLSVLFARMKAKMRMRSYLRKKQTIDGSAIMGFLGEEVSRVVPDINPSVEYNLAISFLTPHNFVRDHVRAKKKICWIHTDYTRIDVNTELELPIWDSFDYIASISSEAAKTFLQVFPTLAPKIIEIENILSSAFVRHRAEEFDAQNSLLTAHSSQLTADKKYINLLSVGRFCEAKNYDNLPDICKRTLEIIKDKNIDIRWYIIGFGADENLIRQKIAEAGMQDHVIILGKKSNPYPYIKACDIYVQPSRYEGKSVTVREAQMLCKPVVVTNYPTASSQIQDGVDGVIVPMDNEGCAKGLAEFILDTEKQEHIIEYLKAHDYGNVEEVEKIYSIISEKE